MATVIIEVTHRRTKDWPQGKQQQVETGHQNMHLCVTIMNMHRINMYQMNTPKVGEFLRLIVSMGKITEENIISSIHPRKGDHQTIIKDILLDIEIHLIMEGVGLYRLDIRKLK